MYNQQNYDDDDLSNINLEKDINTQLKLTKNELDIQNRQLTSVWCLKTIAKRLKMLNVSNNELNIVDNMYLFTNLEYLNISFNETKRFDLQDSQLVNLTELLISNNNLKSTEIITQSFPALRRLNISMNVIKSLQNICLLTSLQYLNAAYNQLKKLEGIQNLIYLKTLYLQGNKIDDIQQFKYLNKLPQLEYFYFKHGVDENPLCKTLQIQYRRQTLRYLPKQILVFDYWHTDLYVVENERKLLDTYNNIQGDLYQLDQSQGQAIKNIQLQNNQIEQQLNQVFSKNQVEDLIQDFSINKNGTANQENIQSNYYDQIQQSNQMNKLAIAVNENEMRQIKQDIEYEAQEVKQQYDDIDDDF